MFKKFNKKISIFLISLLCLGILAAKYRGDLEALESIVLPEQGSTPANPASGKHKFYVKTDGSPYLLDSTGSEKPFGSDLGLKNRIMNGDFSIWQRGTSFAGLTADTFTADRWEAVPGIGGTITVSRQNFIAGQTAVPGNPQHFYRIQVTTTGTGSAEIRNYMEDVTWRAGQTVMMSFWAKASVATTANMRFMQHFGTGGSAQLGHLQGGNNITTSWQKFTFTTTLTSLTGKTIGLDNTHSIWANVYWSNGTAASVDFAQFQVEPGTLSTEFEERPRALELQMCQRYYYKTYGWGVNPGTITNSDPIELRLGGLSTTSHLVRRGHRFPVLMRVMPTVTLYSLQTGASGNFYDYTAGADVPASAVRVGPHAISIEYTLTSASALHVAGHFTADAEF